ncbi:AAA family ATPase [Christiangramia sabulilitoris]|uniref:AAA family ATPase n=1 Tax=Christiangramia sabulilitoris TaxID=2583991 RepID=A0A550I7I4_9FLAO|nr:ATP-binding protein [Christiangramia sabulilitoris]TRO66934.1 AAA family ATPase [Christiangramia sabulilitoris]
MLTNNKHEALTGISNIYNALEKKKLAPQAFKKVKTELERLAEKMDCSEEEAFIFSLIFTLNLEESVACYSSISKALGCNVIEIMTYSSSFQTLVNKNLVIEKKGRNHYGKTSHAFIISDAIQAAVINNEFPLKPVTTEIKNQVEVLEEIYKISSRYNEEEISFSEMSRKTDHLLERYGNFSLLKNIKAFELNDTDRALLLYMLWKTISGSETVYMSVALEGLIKNASRRVGYSQKLISGENDLIRKNLIELDKAGFFNDSDLKLAENGKLLLEKEGIKIGEADKKDIISSGSIRAKQLHYNEKETQNLNLLSKALKPERFLEVQEMLDAKDLPIGFNCIFYGPPGTGKTEGVLQLARKTGRDVMRVDISETKSKWFGDSEKLIKKIFTKYESIRTSQTMAPILLFNEADAILSKRTGISDSNIDQTKNTIQNILLEELENFKGIFIATTNLIDNLDAAFERRFLFKIQIDRPGKIAREKIWQEKLEFLTPANHLELARKFKFSGGEIENITRKILMHEIINSEKIDFEAILEFCHQEKFECNSEKNFKEKKTTILGFQNKKDEKINMVR